MKDYPDSKDLITLLIPTHNRHHYLNRILDYYQQCPFHIMVADSTGTVYQPTHPFDSSLVYLHLPNESLMSKLEIAINAVHTPFLVMCADDDFIIPSAVISCIDFLKNNKDYSSAQGNALSYNKSMLHNDAIEFGVMYKHLLSFSIAEDDPYERLISFFRNYRTLFYGVHYTANLRLAFSKTAAVIKNLYLNEYLTGIIPIVAGKYKELNLLYQVREETDDSGDKTTINLDVIAYQDTYATEYNNYLDLISEKIFFLHQGRHEVNKNKVSMVLKQYADTLNIKRPVTFKKRIGKALASFPYGGKLLIEYHRRVEKANEVKKVVKTDNDLKELKKIEKVILKYTALIPK